MDTNGIVKLIVSVVAFLQACRLPISTDTDKSSAVSIAIHGAKIEKH